MTFDEATYLTAVKTVAEQVAAMVREDYPDETPEDKRQYAVGYVATTFTEIEQALKDVLR